MTTGQTIDSRLTPVTYYLNGSGNGTIVVGTLRTRTWDGQDSVKTVRPAGVKRTYTTVDRRGKLVTRYFYERPPKRQFALKPNPYSTTRFYYFGKPGTATQHTQYETRQLSNWTFSADNPVLLAKQYLDGNEELKLINRLKEKVRGSEFNAGIMLAEGNQTAQLIGDSAIRIVRALRLAARGNIIGAAHELSKSARHFAEIRRKVSKRYWSTHFRRNATDRLSSVWLELRYGWMPALEDIQEGAKSLAHLLNFPMRQKARASIRKYTERIPTDSLWGADRAYSVTRKRIIATLSEPESIPKFLGLTDIASVVWEKIPFSFVADWVIPFGSYLEARGFAQGLRGEFVITTTYERVWEGLVGKTYDTGLLHGSTVVGTAGYECKDVSVDRIITSALTVPMPNVKPLNKVLSYIHCVNGIALLAQLAKQPLTWSAPVRRLGRG